MRKSLILMLIATILVGAFLVSCNSDISSESSNGDKLVEISISGNEKGISAIATADNADDYYWYYTATKADNSVYRTGQTANWTPIKKAGETNDNFTAGLTGRSLGYFSKGDWKFSFRAYSTKQASFIDDGFAYYQNDLGVKVEESTKYVTVTVKESSLAANADVVFNTLNWKYTPQNNTEFNETLSYLNGKEVYIFFAYSEDGQNYTSLARSKGTVYTYDSNDKKQGEEGFTSPGIFAKAEFTSFYKYEDSDYSSTKTDVKLPASVSGKALTLKYWVETVPVDNIAAETIGTESTVSVTAYSGGKVTVSVDSTGVAVSGNEHLEEVIIDKGVISVVATKVDQNFTYKAADENVTSSRVSNAATIVFETQVTGVSAEESTSDKKTTITFPADSLVTSDNTTADASVNVSMEVVVYQTEAAAVDSTFSITNSNSTTFAGLTLDVTLIETVGETTTETKVEEFNNKEVTIVTYIAKGLTNVNVANMSGGYIVSDSTYYNPETGRLEFKTTHFSDFAVGADQNVYDKTSNTGYRIGTSDYGTDKEGLLLNGANAVVAVNKDHEYLLLDKTKANDVADSIDAFNSYINWSVVHPASDTPNTDDFDGGYGTKVEPYLIDSTSKMKNISNLYNSDYSYFKIKTPDSSFDASSWTSVNINGSFDGNGATFNNLCNSLFNNIGKVSNGKTYVIKNTTVDANINRSYSSAVGFSAGNNLVMDNIVVHGTISGNNGAASFVVFGPGNIPGGTGQEPMNWVFRNCISDANIVATGDMAVGFVKHPYCYASQKGTNAAALACCLITIEDSIFKGTLTAQSSAKAKYFVGNANDMLVKTIYSAEFLALHGNPEGTRYTTPTAKTEDCVFFIGNYPGQGKNVSGYSDYGICMDEYLCNGTIPYVSLNVQVAKGSVITVDKVDSAAYAVANLEIAPNDENDYGSYLGTYMSETMSLSENTFSTSNIKYFDITINGNATDSTGISGNTFNVVNSFYGHTYNVAGIRVVQYDSNNTPIHVTYYSFPKNN